MKEVLGVYKLFSISTTLKSLVIVVSFLTFSSCGKAPGCWGENKNKGEIINNFTIRSCTSTLYGENHEFIIRTSNDLNSSEACMIDISGFDFASQSIIGKTVYGGCTMKIKRDLTINHETKIYTYKIIAKDCGFCKKELYNDNLVVVPAIPQDYQVVFEVEKK